MGCKKCLRCGALWTPTHEPICPAKRFACNTCGMKGHYARFCTNANQPRPMQPFPHLDPWDPRVQLQYTLDRLEEKEDGQHAALVSRARMVKEFACVGLSGVS